MNRSAIIIVTTLTMLLLKRDNDRNKNNNNNSRCESAARAPYAQHKSYQKSKHANDSQRASGRQNHIKPWHKQLNM